MCYMEITAICAVCKREFKADRVCDGFQLVSTTSETEEWHSETYTYYDRLEYKDKCPRCMTQEEESEKKTVMGASRHRNRPKQRKERHDEPLLENYKTPYLLQMSNEILEKVED